MVDKDRASNMLDGFCRKMMVMEKEMQVKRAGDQC